MAATVHTPMMAMVCMSRADRGPTVSLATASLMAELDRCRSGEDGRITIERHYKRRRNLKRDFGPPATAPTGHATRTPSSPRVVGGCMELAPHLHMVVWLHKFWPHLSEKYDGSVNHAKFVQIYTTSILAARGNEVVMANYFPVALTGTAQSWLMNLPPGYLYSWEELCRQFMANF
jgi:hypothetical protein